MSDPKSTDKESAAEALVSLTGDGLDHVNTLLPGPEVREIAIAQGKQFRNGDHAMLWSMPAVLRLSQSQRAALHPKLRQYFPSMTTFPPVPLEDAGGGTFKYLSVEQGVLFKIRVLMAKKDFVTALDTPDLHLIYSGHARYGRGPCFGAGGASGGLEWEEGHGDHPNDDGIFRMGYPFIGIPALEILEHQYVANLVPSDVRLAPADCEITLRRSLSGLHARTLDQIDPKLFPYVADSDPHKKWWTYGKGDNLSVVHYAGWQDTFSKPDELGQVDPTCRVFCHFGCDSFHHNYPVVRKLKGWRRDGDERYAYWTTAISRGVTDVYWLYHILTYPHFNAHQPLARSLEYAVSKTNVYLDKDNWGYRII